MRAKPIWLECSSDIRRFDLCAICEGKGDTGFFSYEPDLAVGVRIVLQQMGPNVEARVESAFHFTIGDDPLADYLNDEDSNVDEDCSDIDHYLIWGGHDSAYYHSTEEMSDDCELSIFECDAELNDKVPVACSMCDKGYGVAQLSFKLPSSHKKPEMVPGYETKIWEGKKKFKVDSADCAMWCFGLHPGEDKDVFTKLLNVGDTIELRFKESAAPDNWQVSFFDCHKKPLVDVGDALGVGRTHTINEKCFEYRPELSILVTQKIATKLKGNPDRGFCLGLLCKGLTVTAIIHRVGRKKKLDAVTMRAMRKSTIADAKSHPVLIDGLNIALHFDGMASRALTCLVDALKKNGLDWHIVFDANVRHVLKEKGDAEGIKLLNSLVHKKKNCTIAASGTRADECLLIYANQHGNHIVSCDRYADYAQIYPWVSKLDEDGRRIHPVTLMQGELLVPSLGICVSVTD